MFGHPCRRSKGCELAREQFPLGSERGCHVQKVLMAQDAPPVLYSFALQSSSSISWRTRPSKRFVGRMNLTPVTHLRHSSCQTGDTVPNTAHTPRFVAFLSHQRGLLLYPHPYLSHLAAISSHSATLFPLYYSVVFFFFTEQFWLLKSGSDP